MMNLPTHQKEMNKRHYYVYHVNAEELLRNRVRYHGKKSIHGQDKHMPLCEKTIPKDGTARHGRNFQNKPDIFFMTIKQGG